jgi:class 3 adenylate cyclase/tetratricopeptide (TPR) repeat protein
VKTCPACGQKSPEQARFCPSCGTALTTAPPRAEERKVITILFTDLVGFTSKAEQLDPEAVRGMLDPYYAELRKELERHGGTVEKFIGDAVMAIFGAPVAHEDDAERAVRAAFAIQTAVATMNAADPELGLRVRIGINTGEALVVLDAKPSEGEAMAAGDVINTAARLQTAAPPDGIVVGEATYRATGHAIDYEALDPQQVKGKALPVAAWKAVAARYVRARRETSRAPLIGRDAEIAQLRERWEEVLTTRRPALLTLLGPPGIGKSRLLREFTTGLGAAAYWGRCLSYGEGITYWPVEEMLRDAAGILHTDASTELFEKVGALVEALRVTDAAEGRTLAMAVGTLIGATGAAGSDVSPARISRTELHWAVRRVFERLAGRGPIVLVFEDLHWAEPTLLDLIHYIANGADAPILVLASSRPELVETRVGFVAGDRSTLRLSALTASQSETLLNGLLGAPNLPAATVERLLRNAGGNPLFLEETVGMLAGSAMATGGKPLENVDSLPVPSSLQSLIEARVDQLPAREKRVTQHASVVGGVFWSGAVAHLNETREGIDDDLAMLERRDLIEAAAASSIANEDEYAFKHILIRDVAYGELPKGRRAALHARIAEWIDALPGAADQYLEIVAYHLEQSCRLVRELGRTTFVPPVAAATEALARAGEKAERREGFREAERFYTRALDVLGTSDDERRVALRLRRGLALKALGELGAATSELAEVEQRAFVAERADLRAEALIALANIDGKQGRPADARRRLEEAEAIVRVIGNPRLLVQEAFEHAGFKAHFDNGQDLAIEDLRRVMPAAQTVGDRALLLEGHMRLGTALFNVGRLAESERELVRCSDLAAESGHFRAKARADSLLGFVKYYRGDLAEAERLGTEAHDLLDRTGDSYIQLQNYHKLAMYAIARGEPHLAEERLREGLPLALQIGGWIVPETYRRLAEALVRQGRVSEAVECAALAAANAPEGDGYARPAMLIADAIVKTARHEPAAIQRFNDAVRSLEDQQLAVDLGEARMALAWGLRAFGDPAGARSELERARETFARMDARGVVDQIDREIGELAKGPGPSGPFATSTAI